MKTKKRIRMLEDTIDCLQERIAAIENVEPVKEALKEAAKARRIFTDEIIEEWFHGQFEAGPLKTGSMQKIFDRIAESDREASWRAYKEWAIRNNLSSEILKETA